VIENLLGLGMNLTVDAQYLQRGVQFRKMYSLFLTFLDVLRLDKSRKSVDRVGGSREDQKQAVDYVANLGRQVKEAKATRSGISTRDIMSAGFD
jgi:hypothetical protein